MGRFKLTLEYEGTRYSGWQIQKNSRTVQGELVHALGTVLKTRTFELYGSGRTDAGVHALHQVAHLDVETVLSPEVLRMKMNDVLPADINVLGVERTYGKFHARHDAVGRSYLYQISRRRTALAKRFVWWIKEDLDVGRMREAAGAFDGMKDLRSFTDDDPEEKSTRVALEEAAVKEYGDLILIRIHGSHFLWKLVRRIVGVIAGVGRGHLDLREVHRFLAADLDVPATLTAPPSGLFLERVYYKGDRRLKTLEPAIPVGR
jgi:tRNA pseudouridine38-40 synthase